MTDEQPAFSDALGSTEELEALYGLPVEAVVSKIIDRLDGHCRDFIACAPFVLVATADEDGNCDVSPKGGAPGFVAVLDEKRLAIPDAPGNRLVYSLKNVVSSHRVGLLFLIPGMEETLRVNGAARIIRDQAVLERCAVEGKRPNLAVAVEVQEAFIHCPKCFLRSKLWDTATWPNRADLPTMGAMMVDMLKMDIPVETVEQALDEAHKKLY